MLFSLTENFAIHILDQSTFRPSNINTGKGLMGLKHQASRLYVFCAGGYTFYSNRCLERRCFEESLLCSVGVLKRQCCEESVF